MASTEQIQGVMPPRTDFSVDGYYREFKNAVSDESLDLMYEQRERVLKQIGTMPKTETLKVGGYNRAGYGLSSDQQKKALTNLWMAYGNRQNDFDDNDLKVTEKRVQVQIKKDSGRNLTPEEQLSQALRAMS